MIFVGDIGVVLSFAVADDLTAATQIELLVDNKVFLCTIPVSPTDSPTYTTTGLENFTPGNLPAQLKITFSASRVFHTPFFQIEVQNPNPG